MERNKIDKTKQLTNKMNWTKKSNIVQILNQTIGLSPISTKSGITLIVLIVTIIIMLILAGIVLSLILGENGIIKKAESSGLVYEEQQAREKLELVLLDIRSR